MLKFSATKGRKNGKAYYKGYKPTECEMWEVGAFLREYSVSAFIYGTGETAKGEVCDGHRAAASIIGAGNVLLLDIDQHTEEARLRTALSEVSAYFIESRSSSQELLKWHVMLELDEYAPRDKEGFAELWHGTVQWLGLADVCDPAQASRTQQLAPSWRDGGIYSAGAPVCCKAVRAAYEAPAEGGRGKGISGYLANTTTFVLSDTQKAVGIDEMVTLVKRHGKQRVHCVHGIVHGNNVDSALVNVSDSGEPFYYCSGGRCASEGVLGLKPPFEADEADFEVEVIEEGTFDLWSWPAEAARIVREHVVFSSVFGEDGTVSDREAAVSYACTYMLGRIGARVIDDEICIFQGSQWEAAFPTEQRLRLWIGNVCRAMHPLTVPFATHDARLRGIIGAVRGAVPSAEAAPAANIINLKNCMVHIGRENIKVLPHHPAMLFRHTLPYAYDEAATCPTWEIVASRVMCDRPALVEALQQAMGYLLLRDTQFEKMIAFVGEGENGKSTVMRVLKHLVGRHGYGALPIKTLLRDDNNGLFTRAQMAGKLINITNELTPNDITADTFKDLVSGEDILARHPQGKSFVLSTVPKQLVAMNTTDHLIKERSHGFMRRLHLIPFDYRLKDEHKDDRLHDKLMGELAGILNWCLEGAKAVISSGKLAVAQPMVDLLAEVEMDANPVLQFIEGRVRIKDGTETKPSDITSAHDMHRTYIDFCAENGNKPLAFRRFCNELKRLNRVEYVDSATRVEGKLVRLKGYRCEVFAKTFEPDYSHLTVVK